MNMDLQWFERMLELRIRKTGRAPELGGQLLAPHEVADAAGAMPLFLAHAASLLTAIEPGAAQEKWFGPLGLVEDSKSLIGHRVVFDAARPEPEFGWYPVMALYCEAVDVACHFSEDGKLQLETLQPAQTPEVLHALSISRGSWAAVSAAHHARPTP